MKRINLPRFLISLLIVICLVINLSQPFAINIGSIHQKFSGIKLDKILHRNLSFHRGLDLEGGTSVTLKADMSGIPQAQRDSALDSAKTVIERRVNLFGVSEPVVQTAKINKDYRVIVEIPGITDVNEAVKLVGKTAKLTFWEGSASPAAALNTNEALKAAIELNKPLGIIQLLGTDAKQTNLTGGDLKLAAVTFDSQTGKPQVSLTFTTDGGKKFADITKRNVSKILAIALDDQLIEAPRVNEPIYGGSAVITGEFTTDQARMLQIQLNAGALPVSLSVLEQHAIGATLGQESLQKSLVAGVLGFAVIVLFMIAFYGRLGFIASVALTVYALIVLTLFQVIPVTLTLAGIAGFILSIGIAVDANILIFERMKEELRLGKSRQMAIDNGFSRAWLSIRDSNIASLITSSVLYYFGTGMIRGFAFTLALGVLVSMFSAIFVTRTLLRVFYKK
ncbi:protein translocase subunit SecD [Candidatus Roizmanbacteria bacterium]|nr:protein translocase subunit SecD [Candidatus Roizmanbacteria bacterium]